MTKKEILVAFQHMISAFGATILVPLLTGLPVSMALFGSGVGTIIFYFTTEKKVPAYLGSSFAFIGAIASVVETSGVPYALGGILVAGVIYVLTSYLFKVINTDVIMDLFSPVVVGPIIMLIGLSLADVAIDQIGSNPFLGVLALTLIIISSVYFKGFWKMIPILFSIGITYIVALVFGAVDTSAVAEASWIGFPDFHTPSFAWSPIILIAPIAVVTIIEHIGDIVAISETIGKERRLLNEPGLEKTMLGDGLATIFAGFTGAPPNTTYGENIGVLALTGIYKPLVVVIGGVFAIIASFVPKFSAVIQSIPEGAIGGVSIALFGMIAGVGMKTLIENDVNLKKSRNLLIISITLVLGLGGAVIPVGNFELSSLTIAAIVAVVLNQILPE